MKNYRQCVQSRSDVTILWISLSILGASMLIYIMQSLGFFTFFCNVVVECGADFKLNFVTELIGILLSLLILSPVINYFVRTRNRRETQQMRYFAFKDAMDIYFKLGHIWALAAKHIVSKNPGMYKLEEHSGILNQYYSELIMGLDLNDSLHSNAKITWKKYICREVEFVQGRIDRVFSRHAGALDMNIATSLQSIEDSDFFSYTVNLLANEELDQAFGITRSSLFSWTSQREESDGPRDDFVDAMNVLGMHLADAFPEFSGMADIPEEFDQHMSKQHKSICRVNKSD